MSIKCRNSADTIKMKEIAAKGEKWLKGKESPSAGALTARPRIHRSKAMPVAGTAMVAGNLLSSYVDRECDETSSEIDELREIVSPTLRHSLRAGTMPLENFSRRTNPQSHRKKQEKERPQRPWKRKKASRVRPVRITQGKDPVSGAASHLFFRKKPLSKGARQFFSKVVSVMKIAAKCVKAIGDGIAFVIRNFILLLIILLMAVVIVLMIATGGEDPDVTHPLIPLTAEGTVAGSEISLDISDHNGVILSFRTLFLNDSFTYTDSAEETYMSGAASGDEIRITGKIDGVPTALKGDYVSPSGFTMHGFLGENAVKALNGDWQNPFGSVRYIITSEFGWRLHPIENVRKYHSGYDLCSETGENSYVYAAAEGKVSFAGVYGGYGNAVIIDHGNGLESLYGHLNRIAVQEGDSVHASQLIGTEGNTGNSTGAHLHFEVRKDGVPVDGAEYLRTLYTNAIRIDT